MAVHIEPDGELEIIYNGPGKTVHDFLRENKRKHYKAKWYTVSATHLRELNELVEETERVSEK